MPSLYPVLYDKSVSTRRAVNGRWNQIFQYYVNRRTVSNFYLHDIVRIIAKGREKGEKMLPRLSVRLFAKEEKVHKKNNYLDVLSLSLHLHVAKYQYIRSKIKVRFMSSKCVGLIIIQL